MPKNVARREATSFSFDGSYLDCSVRRFLRGVRLSTIETKHPWRHATHYQPFAWEVVNH